MCRADKSGFIVQNDLDGYLFKKTLKAPFLYSRVHNADEDTAIILFRVIKPDLSPQCGIFDGPGFFTF